MSIQGPTQRDNGQSAVRCIVERIFPFGVFVRLDDGAQGYIRRRELTLSGDTDPREVVSKHQAIQAVVIGPASHGKTVGLSVRATLPDPWPEFIRQYQSNSPVPVKIKHIYADGATVEIVPGIDGFIPLSELAVDSSINQPEEVVWPEDRSEAVITRIDHAHRRVQLSIRKWADRLAKVEPILAFIHRKQEASESKDQHHIPAPIESTPIDAKIALNGAVLVVEDLDSLRGPLVDWLSEQGCETVGAASAREALTICAEKPFALAIIDLEMPAVNGSVLVHELRNCGYPVEIAVMSNPDLIAAQLPVLREAKILTAFAKPLDQNEIRHTLLQLTRGEQPVFPAEFDEPLLPKEVTDFQNLSTIMQGAGEIVERLQLGLERLVGEVRAYVGVIFYLNSASHQVSMLAQTGPFLLQDLALYDLISSPVKDVIREGSLLWENRVSAEEGRFRKLRELLAFESCIGIPLEAGGRIEHALFLFHREQDAFPSFRLRNALAYAGLFNAVLESQQFEDRVQTVSGILLSGQLASAFSHEVYNKVSGLDLHITNVRSQVLQTAPSWTGGAVNDLLANLVDAVTQAAEMATELKRTVQDFQRLTRSGNEQAVDVNQAVRATRVLVGPLIIREKVEVRLDLGEQLPLIAGSTIRLQQVILNLMLNAVQHMVSQPEERRVLRVVTSAPVGGDNCVVQIRVIDTGLGIHRKLWDKVFALGFTTRQGGSGLGLYIAQSLVKSIGGTIVVESSLMQLGTTFLIELPALLHSTTGMGADS